MINKINNAKVEVNRFKIKFYLKNIGNGNIIIVTDILTYYLILN